MKKNFFKKLSFILALAMIVTALAPAAGAFAAAKPKLNSTSKTLFLDQGSKGEYDFNISGKKSGWKYNWTSANEKVVSVNPKNGEVVAEGAGKTKVTVVISDKKGEELYKLSAEVLVRDNIKELKISNADKAEKLAVGEAFDFNRSYVTYAGLTKGSQAITRWTVTDAEGKETDKATIVHDSGVFVAKEAGEYIVTARAFQSKAKYNLWLSDKEKYAEYVTSNEATHKVVVGVSLKEVKQTTLNKFTLEFDSKIAQEVVDNFRDGVDKREKNLKIRYELGGTEINTDIPVKELKLDDTGKLVTVEMYTPFIEKTPYNVYVEGMGKGSFISATTDYKDVTGIEITTTTADQFKETPVNYNLTNANGVILSSGNDERANILKARVDLEKISNDDVSFDGTSLYMYELNKTTTIKATYHATYEYDKDGRETGVLTDDQVITCVDPTAAQLGTVSAYTVLNSNTSSASDLKFDSPVKNVFKGAENKRLFVQLTGTDENKKEKKINNLEDTGYNWEMKSSNDDILYVGNDGALWPAREGAVSVVVSVDGKVVGACAVTVTGQERAARIELDKNNLPLYGWFENSGSVKVTVRNQSGDKYGLAHEVTVEPASSDEIAGGLLNGGSAYRTNQNESDVPFAANNSLTEGLDVRGGGTFSYKVTVTDYANKDAKIYTYFTVTVEKPKDKNVAYYKIEATANSYDVKSKLGKNSDGSEKPFAGATATLQLYGYNSANKKVSNPDITTELNTSTDIEVRRGSDVALAVSGSSVALTSFDYPVVSGTTLKVVKPFVKPLENGTYVVKSGVKIGGKEIRTTTFTVKNTQDKVAMSIEKRFTNLEIGLAALKDCFKFKIDGNEIDITNADFHATPDFQHMYGSTYQVKPLTIYEYVGMDGADRVYVKHVIDMRDTVIQSSMK
ncbi:putative secreted protein [Anaerotaenia torta]|uniref:hypothetical protein n=1 Tax=Anaerotaenia torta TaxID=433293 RepID=UPI003D203B96